MSGESRATTSISVIVPTFNRRSRLLRLLAALERETQTCAFEVIVAIDGPPDGTREALERYAPPYPLLVLSVAGRGAAAARNVAMRMATGDILVFLDDDVIPQPGLLTRHAKAHAASPSIVAIGPMLAPPDARLAPWLLWEARTLWKQYELLASGRANATARQFWTANASVRRRDAIAIGGFDETYRRAEDVEFAFRLANLPAVQFCYLRDAIVFHEPDRSLAAWLAVASAYGQADVRLELEHGDGIRWPYVELPTRHPISRALARWCVGRTRRSRFVMRTLTALIRVSHALRATRLGVLACSAAYNIQYWEGVAGATGLGTAVWHPTPDPSRPASARVGS